MLNRSTAIAPSEPLSTDIRGEATWRCRYGHVTQVWLRFDGHHARGGSAWDFCDYCSEAPNPAEDTRASLSIFSQWLDNGQISREQYRALCHAATAVPYSPHIEGIGPAMLGLPI